MIMIHGGSLNIELLTPMPFWPLNETDDGRSAA